LLDFFVRAVFKIHHHVTRRRNRSNQSFNFKCMAFASRF
jgi:hypothetical protein